MLPSSFKLEKNSLVQSSFRFGKIALLFLTALALVVFVQNYFRYYTSRDYSPSSNLIYNVVIYITFAFFTPAIFLLAKRFSFQRLRTWQFFGAHLLMSVSIGVIHMILCNTFLYALDLTPTLIFDRFIWKYLTGVIQVHLLIYWAVLAIVTFPTTELKKKTKNAPEKNLRSDGFVIQNGRQEFLPFDQILWIEAFDHYQKLHTSEGYHIIKDTMKGIEQKVKGAGFARIHRSYLVNTSKIIGYYPNRGEHVVELLNQNKLKVSQTYLKNLPQASASDFTFRE